MTFPYCTLREPCTCLVCSRQCAFWANAANKAKWSELTSPKRKRGKNVALKNNLAVVQVLRT